MMMSSEASSVYSEKKIAAYESTFKESSFAKPQDVFLTVSVAHVYGQAYVMEQQGTAEGDPVYTRFVCPYEEITKVYINDNVKSSPLFIQCDKDVKGVVHRKRIIVPSLSNVADIVAQINEVKASYMLKYNAQQERLKEQKRTELENQRREEQARARRKELVSGPTLSKLAPADDILSDITEQTAQVIAPESPKAADSARKPDIPKQAEPVNKSDDSHNPPPVSPANEPVQEKGKINLNLTTPINLKDAANVAGEKAAGFFKNAIGKAADKLSAVSVSAKNESEPVSYVDAAAQAALDKLNANTANADDFFKKKSDTTEEENASKLAAAEAERAAAQLAEKAAKLAAEKAAAEEAEKAAKLAAEKAAAEEAEKAAKLAAEKAAAEEAEKAARLAAEKAAADEAEKAAKLAAERAAAEEAKKAAKFAADKAAFDEAEKAAARLAQKAAADDAEKAARLAAEKVSAEKAEKAAKLVVEQAVAEEAAKAPKPAVKSSSAAKPVSTGEKMSLSDFETATKKLKSMLDSGVLTQEEFAQEKKKLLANLY